MIAPAPPEERKKGMDNKRFTPDQEKEICRIYFEDRLSTVKLAEQFQCFSSIIQRLIKRNGFKLRSISETNKGKLNGRWKGGRAHRGSGYIGIFRPDHPNADYKGYVREHRLIMEEHLGRLLNSKEVVHHINRNRIDNRIENLILFTGRKEHLSWHRKIKRETLLLQKDFT